MSNTDRIIEISNTEDGGACLELSKNKDDLLVAMTLLFMEMQSNNELLEILNKAIFISQNDLFKAVFIEDQED